MPHQLVVFEDDLHPDLEPLTLTRPASRLRCGILTLWEKLAAAYPQAELVIHARPELADATAEELPEARVNRPRGDAALLVNGRLLAPPNLETLIPVEGKDRAYVHDGQVAAARVSGSTLECVAGLLVNGPLPHGWAEKLPSEEIDVTLVRYFWQLIEHNAAQIDADFQRLHLGAEMLGHAHPSAVLDGRAHIHVAEGAELQPGVVLVAHDGPVYIGPGAKIMAGAVLQGPVAVGPRAMVKMQAKIYEGTTIGEGCKVGGEVEESILVGYSNKQHDGFLGHAYLGEWINLGADTNNSDLKNNYSAVEVTINRRKVNSGSLFVGAAIGDHSKTGINSMLNTGTVIGVGCNIFGAGFPPKHVPSFCWGGGDRFVIHDAEKFTTTAEKVMARRKRKLTPAGKAMLMSAFRATAAERDEFLSGLAGSGGG